MVSQPIVFVVDDDTFAAQSVAALMASIGLPSETFASAEAFLERCSGFTVEGSTGRACLVLDVRLPGISGPDLHRTLVARGIEIPTILVSGHIAFEGESIPDELTCLEKPYPSNELTDRVKAALGL